MQDEGFVLAVAAAIVRRFPDGERVLALRRAATKDAGAGLWETGSGRVDAASREQPLAAIERELSEETGLEVRVDPRPIDAYVAMRGTRPMAVVFYRAEWIAGEVVRSDEHDAHAWWTPAEVLASAMPQRLVEAVRRALANM